MSINAIGHNPWNLAAAHQAHKSAETTGALAENKQKNPFMKPQNAETAGAIAFENGTYSSAQSGHFEAAA